MHNTPNLNRCLHPPIPLLCRKGFVKKREHGDDDEADAKVDPEPDVKGECKDEDSGAESEDGKSKTTVPGEEADVRDIIYNLEILGTFFLVEPQNIPES